MDQPIKRVLVVDDDVSILKLVRESLAALLNCEVDTTPSAEYAFELFLKKQYDLLIVDFHMPEIDGALLYSIIRKVCVLVPESGRRVPPMLLMTGFAAQRRAQELLREPGVRALLAKPFSIERLVEKVGDVLAEEP